jgi:MraZ protein
MRSDLVGNSVNPVDEKGRVSLPTKYRIPLSGVDLVLTKSDDPLYPYLRLYSDQDYSQWVDSWFDAEGGYQANRREHQRKMLRLKNFVEPAKIDASYRIRIDPELRSYAQITDKVKFVGMGDHVSIMSLQVAEQLDNVELYDD